MAYEITWRDIPTVTHIRYTCRHCGVMCNVEIDSTELEDHDVLRDRPATWIVVVWGNPNLPVDEYPRKTMRKSRYLVYCSGNCLRDDAASGFVGNMNEPQVNL